MARGVRYGLVVDQFAHRLTWITVVKLVRLGVTRAVARISVLAPARVRTLRITVRVPRDHPVTAVSPNPHVMTAASAALVERTRWAWPIATPIFFRDRLPVCLNTWSTAINGA